MGLNVAAEDLGLVLLVERHDKGQVVGVHELDNGVLLELACTRFGIMARVSA